MYCDAFSLLNRHKITQTSVSSTARSTKTNLPSFLTKPKATSSTSSTSALLSSPNEAIPIEDASSPSKTTDNKKSKLFDRLLKISNIASLLCVVDCTVLPIITIALPLLGLSASASTAAWLHELGHSVALYFVLPVGGMATTMNYLSHEKKSLLSLALVGLSCVYMANGHGGPLLSLLPHGLAHDLHCGTVLHRMTNIVGCACLLSSNILGKRAAGGCAVKDCAVDHGKSTAVDLGVDMELGSSSSCEGKCSDDGHSHSH
jgi:hypothetical protein